MSADLGFLVEVDPDPILTWYGDSGERIELSRRVLANWVAKAANLLVDEFDGGPGSELTVTIDLPDGHWREAYWRLAVAWLGLAGADPADGSATDILVTTADPSGPSGASDPSALLAPSRPGGGMPRSPRGQIREAAVLVSLPMLARGGVGGDAAGVPAGIPVVDEARDLATYGDLLPPSARVRRPVSRDGDLRRVLVAGDGHTFSRALELWSAGGSVVVLPPGSSDAEITRLAAIERAATGP